MRSVLGVDRGTRAGSPRGDRGSAPGTDSVAQPNIAAAHSDVGTMVRRDEHLSKYLRSLRLR